MSSKFTAWEENDPELRAWLSTVKWLKSSVALSQGLGSPDAPSSEELCFHTAPAHPRLQGTRREKTSERKAGVQRKGT